MTDLQKKIISIVLTAVIGMVVGIAGSFGIQVLSGCTTTGSANWDVEIAFTEVENGSIQAQTC